jgi:hypothetical protein
MNARKVRLGVPREPPVKGCKQAYQFAILSALPVSLFDRIRRYVYPAVLPGKKH